ncbi:UDP-glucose 4-epimerase [Paenibacillus plantiphilus]|uniref:UDP-glucose 4-epimerase n=1 Tax=Paenibacillus plantiphilus TaxID=2905650 RepID=A0ABM9C9G7_9BACL|nr:NAD-dependent epimerase/dehydratase family protein [Paenibacillus plantiphilus]CAH1206227.1 UDP-glucose 4-epimerase [Paenibacillus plantiphilus]
MKIVVTGGAGFIGSRLAVALIGDGHQVVVVDDLSTGCRGSVPAGARFMLMNASDPEMSAFLAAERPKIVYHLAAQADLGRSLLDPSADVTTNVIGTLRVLEGCRRSSAKFILASTAAVFGNAKRFLLSEDTPESPVTPYGLSKRSAERYTVWFWRIYGVPYTILRFANVYGPGQKSTGEGSAVAVFLERMARGLPLIIHGDGSQIRDFVHVDDVVRACVLAAGKGSGETIHIGSGDSRSIAEVAEELARLHAGSLEIRYGDSRPADAARSVFVNDKAALILGWTPHIRFEDGLRSAYDDAFSLDKGADRAQP